MTAYNASIRDPASVTSFGRYTLILDEATTTYEMIVQVLANNPHERDWRAPAGGGALPQAAGQAIGRVGMVR